MKQSSVAFSSNSSIKCRDPFLCQQLLRLLETEESVTRIRMGEALGISRMTAHRMAEQLIAQGLMVERMGKDAVSGRRSHLLTFAPDPPLLLLEVNEESPVMKAYFFYDGKLQQLQADYRLTTDIQGNMLTLCDLARNWWHLAEDTVCVLLDAPTAPFNTGASPLGHMYRVDESHAMRRVLTLYPTLISYCSLLHLRIDQPSRSTLYVRAAQDAPWFIPSGSQSLPLPSCGDVSAETHLMADLLASYCQYIQPDVILWEETAPHPCAASVGITGAWEAVLSPYELQATEKNKDITAVLTHMHTDISILMPKEFSALGHGCHFSVERHALVRHTTFSYLPIKTAAPDALDAGRQQNSRYGSSISAILLQDRFERWSVQAFTCFQ